MVRDDAQARADRRRGGHGQLAVLLREGDEPGRQRAKRGVADDAVAEGGIEMRGADVFRQRQRSRIENRLAALWIRADDRGQDGDRHLADRARSERGLKGVEEDVVARAYLVRVAE